MSMASSSFMIGHKSLGIYVKPCTRFSGLSWNPITRTAVSAKCKNHEMGFLSNNKTRLQCDNKSKSNNFVVYANTEPGAPLPSSPPQSHPMSWAFGLVVSFVLPFFTNKWGPLWVIKNRIENAVQTVENVVEAVEKVAEGVDKIAEKVAADLPQGKLRDLVELIEDVAEKTAKTADSLDNIIDKVQEAEDQMEDIVECVVNDAKNSPKAAQDQ